MKRKADINNVSLPLARSLRRVLEERQEPIRFEDSVWRLSSDPFAVHAALRILRWDIEVQPGESLEHPRNSKLLRGAKEALLVDMHCRNLGGSDISTRVSFRRIVRLVSWMRSQDIQSFDLMGTAEVHHFLSYLAEEMSYLQNSAKQLQPFVALIERLRASTDFSFPIPRDLRVRPTESYVGRGVETSKHELFAPDEYFLKLLEKAASLTEPWVDELLEVREDYIAILTTRRSRKKRADLSVWRDCLSGHAKLIEKVNEITKIDLLSLRGGSNAFVQIYNACFALIGGFTGMRASEILSLKVDCVTYVTHSDGIAYAYLQGPRTKKRNSSVVGMWLAPPIVVRAIELLERLRAPLQVENTKRLSVGYAIRGIWPRAKGAKVQSIGNNTLIPRLNSLASIGSSPIPWHFTMHQLRRGFCRYVVLRDKRGLLALAEQYGHIHWGTTDSGYVGTDFDIDSLLEEEESKELASALTAAIEAERPAGPGSSRLITAVEELPFQGKVATMDAAAAMLAAGVVMVPCDWGYCVYRADLSACKGSDHAPNPLRRAPDVCAACQNFGVDERYLFWWEDRETVARRFLSMPRTPWQARSIAKKRVEVSIKIIKQIKG